MGNVTQQDVYIEYIKLRTACSDSFIAQEQKHNLQTPAADLANLIQRNLDLLDGAFAPVLAIVDADYVQPYYNGMNILRERLDDKDFGTAVGDVKDLASDWKGSAAKSFKYWFLPQFATALANQRRVAAVLVNTYAAVMNLSNVILGHALAIAKSGQEAYKRVGDGTAPIEGGASISDVLTALTVVAGVVAAILSAAGTGGASLILTLEVANVVGDYFTSQIKTVKNKPPLISGSLSAFVTENIVKKVNEEMQQHQTHTKEWEAKIETNIQEIRGHLETQLLPTRPSMVGGPEYSR